MSPVVPSVISAASGVAVCLLAIWISNQIGGNAAGTLVVMYALKCAEETWKREKAA
jgi:hypothetical protein